MVTKGEILLFSPFFYKLAYNLGTRRAIVPWKSSFDSYFNPCQFKRGVWGVVWTPTSGFSQISWKQWGERWRFWSICSCIFFAQLVKIWDPGHSRSGHQVTIDDLTSEKVWMLVYTEWLSPWNFQRVISVTVSMKRLSQNFLYQWPKVSQFCDLSIISQW